MQLVSKTKECPHAALRIPQPQHSEFKIFGLWEQQRALGQCSLLQLQFFLIISPLFFIFKKINTTSLKLGQWPNQPPMLYNKGEDCSVRPGDMR